MLNIASAVILPTIWEENFMKSLRLERIHKKILDEVTKTAHNQLNVFLDEIGNRKPTEANRLLQLEKDLAELAIFCCNVAIQASVRAATLVVLEVLAEAKEP
ncbi:MAG: hypothetical protein AB1523_00110 [Bacillota bacterium]